MDAGVEAIMAGHIMQPVWTRALNPGIQDKDIMPATLSPELLQGLLRGRLGFNGLIVTDASDLPDAAQRAGPRCHRGWL